MATATSTDLVEERKTEKTGPRRAVYWQRQIARARKKEKPWREAAQKVLERYRNEKSDSENAVHRFNILYSNTETIRPAIYAQAPKPDVRRRFLDKDPVAKAAAEVLQRALSACVDMYDLDGMTRRAVNDYLLPGRAVLRVKYRPVTGGTPERVVYQEALTEYVPWTRFVMLPRDARNWGEVKAVCYGVDVTRADAERQFSVKVAEELSYGKSDADQGDATAHERADSALVWEVWSKDDRRVYVVADEGYSEHLTPPVDDPLRLEEFFPSPEPLYSLPSNDTMVPRPEYAQYQDQANELDDITARITKITDALRVRGIRDASKPVLQNLASAADNELVPVEDWLAIQAQGGLDALIAYLPIEHLAKVLLQLYDNRDRTKQTVYEITGVADIVRGASNAQETATAQGIKSKWAGIRIGDRQQAVQKFLRNLLRIKAEIIAEQFTPETLAMMTGLDLPTGQEKQLAQQAMAQQQQAAAMQAQQAQAQGGQPPPPAPPDPKMQAMAIAPSWDEVMALLRQDKLRGFRIDIETDSTIRADADEEQKNRTEMLTSITSYLTGVAPLVQMGTMPVELARELLIWGVRSFRVGPQLEQALEQIGTGGGGNAQAQAQQAQMAQMGQQVAEEKHKAELAQKDLQVKQAQLQRESDKVKYDAALSEAERKFHEELQAMTARMEAKMQELAQAAEGAVNEAQAPLKSQLESMKKPKRIEYDNQGNPIAINGRPLMYGPDGALTGLQ